MPGSSLAGVPADISALYPEARRAAGASAYTVAVMAFRKILMNVVVNEGAAEGLRVVDSGGYLEGLNFFSPKMKPFVDSICKLGHEANHEIASKTEKDAVVSIGFVAALLRHNYKAPGRLPTL